MVNLAFGGIGIEMKTNAKQRYTILVVTWNGDDILRDCLDSVVSAIGTTAPCVVVDNANLDSTRTLCANYPFVKYVPANRNLGFAGGNNLGLRYCETEYVILLNNDTVIHEDSFSPLVNFMDSHPNAGVSQGTMKLPRCGDTFDDCGTMLRSIGIQRHRFFRKPYRDDLEPTKVFAAKGAFMMVRRSAIDAAGGFLFYDDFKSYYEETDFCHRVWLSGNEVWFVPTPPIDHLLGTTSSRFANAAIWRQYLGNIFFSYLVNFGWYGKFRILLPFTFVYLGFLGLNLVKCRFAHLLAALKVPFDIFHRRHDIRRARRTVKGFRILSDHKLLMVAMSHR